MLYFVEKFPNMTKDVKTVVVNNSIKGKKQLFDFYGDELLFPYKTITNFDAFRDVMEELDWLEEREVSICHESLPLLNEPDMQDYLDYLNLIDAEWEMHTERTNITRQYAHKHPDKFLILNELQSFNSQPKLFNIFFMKRDEYFVKNILSTYSWDFRRCISFDEKGLETIDFIARYPK